jgi:phosphatidate cytidylyltransferase
MLVITNDIFAYIFGKIFGKTRLIEISPKKTLEGFIGGFFSSLLFAFFVIKKNK